MIKKNLIFIGKYVNTMRYGIVKNGKNQPEPLQEGKGATILWDIAIQKYKEQYHG